MTYRGMRVAVICAGLAVVPAAGAHADAAAGARLAQRWCVSCHIIGDNPPVAALPQGPPPFRSVARSGKSDDELRTFLMHPHGEMPDLALSRAEIADLIDYINSLR